LNGPGLKKRILGITLARPFPRIKPIIWMNSGEMITTCGFYDDGDMSG
jgi:hypothetical protein